MAMANHPTEAKRQGGRPATLPSSAEGKRKVENGVAEEGKGVVPARSHHAANEGRKEPISHHRGGEDEKTKRERGWCFPHDAPTRRIAHAH